MNAQSSAQACPERACAFPGLAFDDAYRSGSARSDENRCQTSVRRGGSACLPALFATVLATAGALPLEGQVREADERTYPTWAGDLGFLGLNTLAGGVSAALLKRLRGGSFRRGLAGGALGGAVHHVGLHVGSRRFDGAGLLGRQISATGASLVRNAGAEDPLLSSFLFPLGPLHLRVAFGRESPVQLRVNVGALATLVSAASNPELAWDPGASLSAGAPVFRGWERSPFVDGRELHGLTRYGTVVVTREGAPEFRAAVFAHERVHVLQRDWLFQVWSDPAERWALDRLPAGRSVARYIDVDFVAFVGRQLAYRLAGIDDRQTLHEREASFLEGR